MSPERVVNPSEGDAPGVALRGRHEKVGGVQRVHVVRRKRGPLFEGADGIRVVAFLQDQPLVCGYDDELVLLSVWLDDWKPHSKCQRHKGRYTLCLLVPCAVLAETHIYILAARRG